MQELQVRIYGGTGILNYRVQLKQRLGDEYPAVRAMLDTAVCAIDDEYVAADEHVREDVEVALIPPVSGGVGVDEGVRR
jgi:hypothetical protein